MKREIKTPTKHEHLTGACREQDYFNALAETVLGLLDSRNKEVRAAVKATRDGQDVAEAFSEQIAGILQGAFRSHGDFHSKAYGERVVRLVLARLAETAEANDRKRGGGK